MKRLSFHFALLFVSFFCICGMCSKSDSGNADPSLELKHSKGFLVTIGVLNNGNIDSVCLRYGPAEAVTEYGEKSVTGGFIKREKHTWEIMNSGANTWFFKYADGRYLGYDFYEYGTGDGRWQVTMDDTPGEKNMFVINKTGESFVISPVQNQKIFLNTTTMDIQPPSPRHGKVIYQEGKKQLWFIMP